MNLRQKIRNLCTSHGFTLIELSFVILILAMVASLASVKYSSNLRAAKVQAAQADEVTIRSAILGNEVVPGYLCDLSPLPGFTPAFLRLHNLLNRTNVVAVVRESAAAASFVWLDARPTAALAHCARYSAFTNWDSTVSRGWHGPYLQTGGLVKNIVAARVGLFPRLDDRRTTNDRTFGERGFFPAGAEQKLNQAEGNGNAFRSYGVPGEQALGDPWGNPYVIQIPPRTAFADSSTVTDAERFHYARLVSAGPDGVLDTPCYTFASLSGDALRYLLRQAGRAIDGTLGARGDDVVLFLNREDLNEYR